MENHTLPADDYDTPWKDALTRYFPEFMAFYFPQAHAEIDWRQAHVFLDQELAQVVQDAELGRRLVDRLVQVATRTSGEQWVYVHVEVQGQHDADFPERLFTYNYRLYDRYRRPVASLAVLADDSEQWKPTLELPRSGGQVSAWSSSGLGLLGRRVIHGAAAGPSQARGERRGG